MLSFPARSVTRTLQKCLIMAPELRKRGKTEVNKPEPKIEKKKMNKPKAVSKEIQNGISKDEDTKAKTSPKRAKTSNFKITSWNVDGLRAWVKKQGVDFINSEDADIVCLQEIRCNEAKIPEEVKSIEGYKAYYYSAKKGGYSGVSIHTKIEPISVKYGIGTDEFDNEGRSITVEFEKFYLVNTYVPNAGRGLVTLPKRLEWNEKFKDFIKELDQTKPVIICGDMNVSHKEIDLANPKSNKKNAGFTPEERQGMTDFLNEGFLDTYREFYPDKTGAYTFWSNMHNSRAKNVGWRLDYFLVSQRFMENVADNVINSDVLGSDHCPITLLLNI